MNSSVRTVPLEETLRKAKVMAVALGITRVTDTTWLDCVGIPVFAGIRPNAMPGSLCVNAGKGVLADEARVGAYMEAIEFTFAEYRNRTVDVITSTPRHVSTQEDADFEFVDLCPIIGRKVAADGPLACVEAEDIVTGGRLLVPAELVFSPYPENPGQQVFGTSTNGLASGNTVEEATVHGLAELIERDVQAHNFIHDRSRYVEFDTLPPEVDLLLRRIDDAGLTRVVRYTPNAFGLPFFQGFMLEPTDEAPIAIAVGSGLHPFKDIAAVRALAEAAQSRLTYIHGGRDDIIDRHRYFARFDGEFERRTIGRARQRIQADGDTVRYSSVPDGAGGVASIEDALTCLIDILNKNRIRQILRVVLTGKDSPLSVVRVIAPKLESFQPELKRVGPRLLNVMDLVEDTRDAP
ncbi:YcaO-like family protein [Actinoallomurus purpureus]|uniref:YcaO-like family protein n=1 Tax=Actinoallomurus purpureus TaxID=478114 RepID=UPI0020922EF3|nr:YcaO-like family protein [Actinoallomurus purpureus]MCO6003535.1 YcaO-like family protein [Actinoallomurus purpureus]